MITKTQAQLPNIRNLEIHYVKNFCNKTIGPKGGETIKVVRVRASGKCQVWKTRPNEFRLPVKHGLYEHSEINEKNCQDFHFAADCPLNNPEVF